MKKIALTLVVLLTTLLFSMSCVYAQTNIIESPKVKIVIDGKVSEYTDTPIIINGRTLLPLREVLTNLGVQNDDEHIIWNQAEKSVTIHKDSVQILLTVGSTTALVDGKPITLDVAPIVYSKNNRTYIPARFVSEALGKKVIWDGSIYSVLIKDEKSFNEVKEIFNKINETGKTISKLKYTTDAKMNTSIGTDSVDISIKGTTEFDKSKKAMHATASTKAPGQNMDFEYYYLNDAMYMKAPNIEGWQKIALPEGTLDEAFENNCNSSLEATDTICAGLVVSGGTSPDKIVLKGNIYINELVNSGNLDSEDALKALQNVEFENYYLEMEIDKNSNRVEKVYIDIAMAVKVENIIQKISMQATYVYDYTSSFEINIPAEIK